MSRLGHGLFGMPLPGVSARPDGVRREVHPERHVGALAGGRFASRFGIFV